jgi:large subunit ribosomal protein L49
VYQLAKRGGNKLLTVIKKVEGDASTFQDALASALALNEGVVTYNQHTRHVIVAVRSPSSPSDVGIRNRSDQIADRCGAIQGHRRAEIVDWLEKQGF